MYKAFSVVNQSMVGGRRRPLCLYTTRIKTQKKRKKQTARGNGWRCGGKNEEEQEEGVHGVLVPFIAHIHQLKISKLIKFNGPRYFGL